MIALATSAIPAQYGAPPRAQIPGWRAAPYLVFGNPFRNNPRIVEIPELVICELQKSREHTNTVNFFQDHEFTGLFSSRDFRKLGNGHRCPLVLLVVRRL